MSRCSLERLYVTPTHSSHVLYEASRLVHSPLLACRDWLTVVFPNAERNDTDTLLSFLYNCCGKHGGLGMFSAGQPRCAWPTPSKTRYSLVCLSVHRCPAHPHPHPPPSKTRYSLVCLSVHRCPAHPHPPPPKTRYSLVSLSVHRCPAHTRPEMFVGWLLNVPATC